MEHFIAEASTATGVRITDIQPLQGGAVHQHWLIEAAFQGGSCSARERMVLRTHGATRLGMGLDLADEFGLLCALSVRRIPLPPPLFCCADPAVIGRPFHLTRWLPGYAEAARIVADGTNDALAVALAHALADIHGIRPGRTEFAVLGPAPAHPAMARIAEYRRLLDAIGEPRPVAEWGLRWLLQHAPAQLPPVLCHGDFRTGNYLVEGGQLIAILDWEFAGWGDPDEDIAWFCSRCWRGGVDSRQAGGVASGAVFHHAYEEAARRRLDRMRLRYWEVMAALKWLVIALLQRDRCVKGGEAVLDLALTGRRAAECEYEILRLTQNADA